MRETYLFPVQKQGAFNSFIRSSRTGRAPCKPSPFSMRISRESIILSKSFSGSGKVSSPFKRKKIASKDEKTLEGPSPFRELSTNPHHGRWPCCTQETKDRWGKWYPLLIWIAKTNNKYLTLCNKSLFRPFEGWFNWEMIQSYARVGGIWIWNSQWQSQALWKS